MARLRETWDSRRVRVSATGGGTTWKGVLWGTFDEAEAYETARVNTPLTLQGFVREDIDVQPLGGGHWSVSVEYGTRGLGGSGDIPVGADPGSGGPDPGGGGGGGGYNPSQPTGDEALTGGFSFSIEPPSYRITQALSTYSRTKRGATTNDDPNPARSFKGAINVQPDGRVEGAELPPRPESTWQRTVFRPAMSLDYYRTLVSIAGRVNASDWYGFKSGEVYYYGCEAQYTKDGWTITHKFGFSPNVTEPIEICDGLTVEAPDQPAGNDVVKEGFMYLWVAYEEIADDNGLTVTVPEAAYVERVLPYADFTAIGIG